MSPPAAPALALTSLAHGAGCGCKLPAAALLPIVRGLPAVDDERLLVGSSTADDAAVLKLTDEIALVMTIDFFTPIVDDPYDFGRIAAANALSDVYAMGGTPLAAMNVVAFPLEQLGSDILREILRGGADVAAAAGIAVVGGHSIDDPEPKYGMSVTGTVHPDELISNAGARAGDLLVLTKPLGVGAITTARKRGRRDDDLLARGVATMTALNGEASAAARTAGAHAMTDVTGFGLLGHLHSLGRASGVGAVIDASAVPAIEGVLELLAGDDAVSGGSRRNREYAETFTTFGADVEEAARRLLCDATTSGGLLVAIAPEAAPSLPGPVVGEIVAGEPGAVAVR
ncbi:MAG TPA: selenide, water dikinase SelD [Solirubrobacteraceae bacterium]|nr:selenide, water dikinase SelD [Solirubrobacteraceae bacterium]